MLNAITFPPDTALEVPTKSDSYIFVPIDLRMLSPLAFDFQHSDTITTENHAT